MQEKIRKYLFIIFLIYAPLALIFLNFVNCLPMTQPRYRSYKKYSKSEKFGISLTQNEKDLFAKIKGDFKCLKLKDDKNLVWRKLKYLDKNQEIDCYGNLYKWTQAFSDSPPCSPNEKKTGWDIWQNISYDFLDYTTELTLKLYEKKLYKIVIEFPDKTAASYDTEIKKQYNQSVSLLKKKYGKPKYNKMPLWYHLKAGYCSYSAEWDFKEKKIIIGICASTSFRYCCVLYIVDKDLEKEKNKFEKTSKNILEKNTGKDF